MRIVVIGAGAAGLLTGEILGRAGHHVTVIERDRPGVPADDEDAWDGWDRPGVNQLRQPHGLLPSGMSLMSRELPELFDQLHAIDTVATDIMQFAPEGVEQESLPDLHVIGIRRTTFERRLRQLAVTSPHFEIRFGVKNIALTLRNVPQSSIPIVTGVDTPDGVISTELVVDASGRRTSIPKLLDDHGIEYAESREQDGFTYFTRWFRIPQGVQDIPIGFAGMAPGAAVLQFPSDGCTLGVAVVASMADRPIRRLREPEAFDRLIASVPKLASSLAGADPLTDVIPMGSIQNRYLRLARDGRPTVAGLVCIGDSSVSTNPSLGRGISLALRSIVSLRDRLATEPTPHDLAQHIEHGFDQESMAWLTDAMLSDHRLRTVFAAGRREEAIPDPEDPRSIIAAAALIDPLIWAEWVQVGMTYRSPAEVVGNRELVDRATTLLKDVPQTRFLMSRSDLESLLAS